MKVSILGCGWLGLPLAEALIATGYGVKGSTTTEAKLDVLRATGIAPFLISLGENGPDGEVASFLENSDVLIIDIPPKQRGDNTESYSGKIGNLIPYIERFGIEKVLFISSTSVYADDNSAVTEDTIPQPESESGRQVLDAEKLLRENRNFKTTVLRFGGLIGGERHPVKHMAGRNGLANPDAPVNLIHRDDCIGIIKAIVEKSAWGEVFIGVATQHPTRREYYTQKAIEMALEAPEFDDSAISTGKTVSSQKVIKELNYTFIYNLAESLR